MELTICLFDGVESLSEVDRGEDSRLVVVLELAVALATIIGAAIGIGEIG